MVDLEHLALYTRALSLGYRGVQKIQVFLAFSALQPACH